MLQCSVSIVFYNTDQKVADETVRNLCSCSNIETIYILDNGGTIDFINIERMCHDSSKTIEILRAENHGLAIAQNAIINHKDLSEFHLILNPDIFISEDCLTSLLRYLSKNKKVSAVGPKINTPMGETYPSAKLNPDPITQIIRRLFPKHKRNKVYELNSYDFSQPTCVPMISGCFILSRSEFLKNINGFDEKFFLYFEDIDLLMRLKAFGEIHYYPNRNVTHLHSDASRTSFKIMLYHLSSFFKYYSKWGWRLKKKLKDENKTILKNINN
mgnify:FL=1|tara:strand:- start:199 stop:1011 length:813 start_codon:yes stop_codon:yes gene_type:complete